MSRWRLGHQDSYVLTAIEALAGEIDRRVHAITVHVGEDTEGLRFRFWVHDHPVALAEVAEDADDALGDLDAMLQPDPVQCISEEILPGPPPPDIDGWAGRLLYLTPALATEMPHLIPATPVSDSPAPEPGMTNLEWENFYTVCAHQASLGHITATMNALTLHISEDQLGLRVWTAEPADRAVTAQIAHRLHLLLPSDHLPITTEHFSGTRSTTEPAARTERIIFWEK